MKSNALPVTVRVFPFARVRIASTSYCDSPWFTARFVFFLLLVRTNRRGPLASTARYFGENRMKDCLRVKLFSLFLLLPPLRSIYRYVF